jgi:WD40 repeat protein
MAETWARRDGTTLTLAAYRDAGGVHGALARLADDVYAGLDEDEQALARRLFLRLAEPGEGTDDVRRRMPRQEFNAGSAGDDVLDAFVGRRLLIAGAGSVEVAHEALLREWPRLRTWLEEDRDGRRLHRHVTEAAAAWAAEGRDAGALYRGTRLGAALEWAGTHGDDVNPVEREFLDASSDAQHSELQRARRTARRSRSLAAAMAVFLVVALVAGGLALVQRSRASHQAKTARQEALAAEDAKTVSDATALARQASALPSERLDLALLLAAQGRRLDESTATDGALEAVLSRVGGGLDRQVNVQALAGFCTDASADGRLVAAPTSSGAVRLYDATSGLPMQSLRGNRGVYICAQLSPDGKKLAVVDDGTTGGDVLLWDTATSHLDATIPMACPIYAVFAGDDRLLIETSLPCGPGDIRVWDISDPARPAAIGAPYPAGSDVLSHLQDVTLIPHPYAAPGSDLLAFDVSGHTEVWHISTHTLAYPPLPGDAIGESRDGTTLATTVGGQVLLWDAETGQRRGRPLQGFVPSGPGYVVFSPDGRRAAVQSGPTVTVLDRATGTPVGDPITGVTIRYLDNGRLVVGNGQTVQVWNTDNFNPVPFAHLLDGAHTLLAYWLSSGTVYGVPGTSEWDASTGKPIGSGLALPLPPPVSGQPADSVVNPAGTYAAVAKGDNIDLWDVGNHRAASVIDTGQSQPVATWDPAAPIVATTGLGGTLGLWDVSDVIHPKLLARTTVPDYAATGEGRPHFSPDGRTIAIVPVGLAVGLPPGIPLMSVPEAHLLRVLVGGSLVDDAEFSSDSKTVAINLDSYSAEGQVTLWDVATGRLRSTWTVPYPQLQSTAFVDGDRWVVTDESAVNRNTPEEGITSRVNIWDATTGQPIGAPITVNGDAGYVEVDRPGGSRVLTSTTVPSGTDMVLDLDPSDWPSIACNIAGRNLTQAEWKQYLPGRPYQRTCPQWPAGS